MAKYEGGRRYSPRRVVGTGKKGVVYSEYERDRASIYGPTPTREGEVRKGNDSEKGKTSRMLKVSDMVWRYLEGGKKLHALIPGYGLGVDARTWQPVCGIYVLKPGLWKGAGSRKEKITAADLTKCKRCSDYQRAANHVDKF